MILTISAKDKNKNKHIFDDLYQKRYKVFVEKLQWKLDCDHKNKKEKDQFDHEHAVYLIKLDKQKKVIGGIRLMPTIHPHMTKDVFSYLIDKPNSQPISKTIWETSRLFSLTGDQKNSISVQRKTTIEFCQAAVQFGLNNGINQFVTVTNMQIERLYRCLGWPLKRLGNPKKNDGQFILAGLQDIKQSTVDHFQKLLCLL